MSGQEQYEEDLYPTSETDDDICERGLSFETMRTVSSHVENLQKHGEILETRIKVTNDCENLMCEIKAMASMLMGMFDLVKETVHLSLDVKSTIYRCTIFAYHDIFPRKLMELSGH